MRRLNRVLIGFTRLSIRSYLKGSAHSADPLEKHGVVWWCFAGFEGFSVTSDPYFDFCAAHMRFGGQSLKQETDHTFGDLRILPQVWLARHPLGLAGLRDTPFHGCRVRRPCGAQEDCNVIN